MAFDITSRSTQEYLNIKAGFTGVLRTKQECLASLTGRANATNSVIIEQDQANSYAGTTNKIIQDALNNKVGSGGATLTKQEAVRRL